jgi:hypothetical protein
LVILPRRRESEIYPTVVERITVHVVNPGGARQEIAMEIESATSRRIAGDRTPVPPVPPRAPVKPPYPFKVAGVDERRLASVELHLDDASGEEAVGVWPETSFCRQG